jgi:hypothetical protein
LSDALARARQGFLRDEGAAIVGDFPAQAAFVDDLAPRKAAFCTRRASKSYSIGLDHCRSAVKYGGKHLVLGLTRESVRGAFWDDVLKAIDRRYHLAAAFNETRLEVRFPGGGTVRLLGMDSNDNEARKALGQKYRKVAIDEAQDWGTDLEQLVYGVLGPATADLGGQIAMSGTPSNKIKGLFYEVTNGQRADWSVHRWDTTQNTAIPEGQTQRMCDQWAKQIAELKASNPRVVETPWFRQMYLGEWVIEQDKLVYRYAPGRNDYNGTLPHHPRGQWHYVLGVDLGYTDATALTVAAYHDHDRRLHLVRSEKRTGLDITATAQWVRSWAKDYEFDRMVVDNANKQAVEEMKRRHDLPLWPADKTGKSDFIELMNAELIMGHVLVSPACAPLVDEWRGLIWDEKAAKREEHAACPNHCADSALYAWRYCYGYLSQTIAPLPVYGTPEWAKAEDDRLEAEAEERYLRQQEEQWQ